MKLCLLLLCGFSLTSIANTHAQKISLDAQHSSLKKVLVEVARQSGYTFIFKDSDIAHASPIHLSVREMPVEKVLSLVFAEQPLTYSVAGKAVSILPIRNMGRKDVIKGGSSSIDAVTQGQIRGRVVDTLGRPLVGANVSLISVAGVASQVTTNKDGSFFVPLSPDGLNVEISFIGYVTRALNARSDMGIIVLRQLQTDIKEVVISSGFVDRRAESFTGAATTVTGEELFRAGNQNILQSLKNIDPAFRLIENLDMGSNPNNMPEIVLRGKSDMPNLTGDLMGTPNMPLFIVDGFESTLQRVYDMDMNRVKTVTILKDAVAKAIYGAKAGNGVVVIETVQPQAGELVVSYNGNLNLEVPDLTGYNLMNASEKLQWEFDHGMWTSSILETRNFRENMYNSIYQDIHHKGVDTYWLSQPLQTGIGQRHSLNLGGGDESFRYSGSVLYNNITGAMKGSERNTLTGNTMLSYRRNNLLFRNTLEFSQNKGVNSPYGSFADYVRLNPYWTPYAEDGSLRQVLGFYPDSHDARGWINTTNPLYNASLNVIDENRYLQVVNNFYAEYRIDTRWRFMGSLGYVQQRNGGDRFLPPSHTEFLDFTEQNGLINYRGRWAKTDGMSRAIESNIGATYSNTFGKHLLIGNFTVNTNEQLSRNTNLVAEGFGSDAVEDIAMAAYYQRGGAPTGSDNIARTIGVVGLLNYSYDDKLFLDASYRTNGSSQYGPTARWGQFWSLGLGYNLHNERFVQDLGFSQFRLRATTGYTGSQNANYSSIMTTNDYLSIIYNGIRGTVLSAIPNPNLSWQRNIDYNIGMDLGWLNNKLSARIELYQKVTDNQVTSITAPPSMGFNTYVANLGQVENRGAELSLRYQVFNNRHNQSFLNLSAGAVHNKNKLTGIGDAFRSYNKREDEQLDNDNMRYVRPVARYYEGQSMDAIWVMRSLGIDPSSGQELFLDRNGNITNVHSSQDLVVFGDAQPKVNGNFAVNAGYKGFMLSLTCTYRFGGQLYNSTLVDRVENITGHHNLDRRITDAWRQVGDLAIYRAPQVSSIINTVTYTKPTSRFVQDNNELYFSTINLSYDVQSKRLLRKIGMERLRATVYTNEILRLSSIDIERGTSYPFARQLSLSINATF